MEDNKRQQVPERFLLTYNLLKCTFPDGIEPEVYSSILYLLHEEGHMSYRAIAEIISIYMNGAYASIYADAMEVTSHGHTPSAEETNITRQRLLACGYEDWLEQTMP